MQITFPPMTLAPQKHSKTMIAISTPHISTFDLSPPEWKLHTGVERSKVEVAIPQNVGSIIHITTKRV